MAKSDNWIMSGVFTPMPASQTCGTFTEVHPPYCHYKEEFKTARTKDAPCISCRPQCDSVARFGPVDSLSENSSWQDSDR